MTENILIEEFQKLNSILINSKTAVISSHINPDADAIGSELTLWNYLKNIGIETKVINISESPYNLKFLDFDNCILTFSPYLHNDFILNADLSFILDLNDLDRLSDMKEVIEKSKSKKILIDHHLYPKKFADLSIIDFESSSTGELIWRFLNFNNFKIDKFSAQALYAAIMTDTGSFRFSKTNGKVHRIIGDLIDAGAEADFIYNQIYNRLPFKAIKLLGLAFSSLELFFEDKICIMTISNDDFLRTGAMEDDIENFVEKTLSIEGVLAGVLLVEVKSRNEIRISFRSKSNINVRDIAYEFGGGGHLQAAGAILKNISLKTAKEKIIEKFKEKVF